MVWIWVSETKKSGLSLGFFRKNWVWVYETVNVLGGAIRVDFVSLCILIAYRAGRLKFSPTFPHIPSVLFGSQIIEAVRHMSLSFTFRHLATKVKNFGWFGFKFFDFQIKTPVSKILYACLDSNSIICVHKRQKSLSTEFISQLLQVFGDILQSSRLRCCAFKLFFIIWRTLRRKVNAYWSCCNAKLCFYSFSLRSNWKQLPRLIDQACWRDITHENP